MKNLPNKCFTQRTAIMITNRKTRASAILKFVHKCHQCRNCLRFQISGMEFHSNNFSSADCSLKAQQRPPGPTIIVIWKHQSETRTCAFDASERREDDPKNIAVRIKKNTWRRDANHIRRYPTFWGHFKCPASNQRMFPRQVARGCEVFLTVLRTQTDTGNWSLSRAVERNFTTNWRTKLAMQSWGHKKRHNDGKPLNLCLWPDNSQRIHNEQTSRGFEKHNEAASRLSLQKYGSGP